MEKHITTKWMVCLVAVAVAFTGCIPNMIIGSGRVITEIRTVSQFDGISLAGIGDVTITQGGAEALTVEAEDNLMPYLKTEVRNGTLAIYIDSSYGRTAVNPTRPIRFDLTVTNLNSIDLSGAGRLQSASLKSDRLMVRLSGAGSINLDRLEATDVTSTLTGAGNVKMAGLVTTQSTVLSGMGSYDTADLSSQSARIDVKGVGGATVWARDNLDVTISGVGGVKYYGNPRVHESIGGMGGINHLGNK